MKPLFQKILAYGKTHPWTDALILGVGLIIFLAITFGNVTNASIWFDEAFSAYLIQFNYWEILQFTAADVHPPVYYWLLKTWSLVFGTTEIALRSMSIFFGALAIGGGFFIARQFFGRSVAAVSVLFLALAPTLIRYSDEARMYTLATVIVLAATYVLTKAVASKRRGWWIAYGVLVGIGMWTHYFTAVVWLAHWAWRALTMKRYATPKLRRAAFFNKEWMLAHFVAVGLFLPWIPVFAFQTGAVQSGFWIGNVGVETPANYLTNFFFYLEQWQVKDWWALIFFIVLTVAIIVVPKVYKQLTAPEKKKYLLIALIAWLAPAILFVLSLAPLSSVFVERYLIPSMVVGSIFFAATLVLGTRKWRPLFRAVPIVLVAAMMVFGVTNVYKYGNYNKNSHTHIYTRQVIEMVKEKAPVGTPIVANSPWIFYEAVFYTSDEYPVYFIDGATDYIYGSLNMLRDRDMHKIKDIEAFKKEHPVIWYIGNTSEESVPAFQPSWDALQTVGAYDSLTDKTIYKATEYRITEE